MLDFNKPVQTKSGLKVRILCMDKKLAGGMKAAYPVFGLVTEPDGGEAAGTWRLDGTFLEDVPHVWDLVNVPEETVQFLVVYKSGVVGSTYCLPDTDYLRILDIQYIVKVTLVDGKAVKSEPYELV